MLLMVLRQRGVTSYVQHFTMMMKTTVFCWPVSPRVTLPRDQTCHSVAVDSCAVLSVASCTEWSRHVQQ